MRTVVARWLVLAATAVLLAGCSGNDEPSAPDPKETTSVLTAAQALTQVEALIEAGVIPESESVLQASNQGTPAVHMKGTEVAEAYQDVVARFMGEERPLRFIDVRKQGFLQRLFGGR